MNQEKFINLQTALQATCRAEEKRSPGARCGFIFILTESEPGSNEIRMRSSTGLPLELAVQVLEASILDMKTKNMKPDYAVPPQGEVVDTGPPPPNLTCHVCRKQFPHGYAGTCDHCGADEDQIYL